MQRLFSLKILVITFFLLNTTQVHAEPSVRIIKEELEANLYLDNGDPLKPEKVGKSEVELEHSGNRQFKVIINSQAHEFKTPITVYLNDQKLGQTTTSELQTNNKLYKSHKFKLKSKSGDSIPEVREGDYVKLITADNKLIYGQYVKD